MGKTLTLGSLFDGSGGFPLGGLLCGITPVWSSEIEPFAVRVTTKRLPKVQHYGDVSALSGEKLPPVDIITFGSPCQDMSVAGKREGLGGSRSNLFHEAIRIIKEMRYNTNEIYPRYIVWENVPGAFSSNKGEDFKCVLEAVGKVKDDEFSVPECKKWLTAGGVMGDDFSIAWRVLDAQYWGVPQRRKRIYLVADFAGGSAGEILFDSEGLSRYSAESFGAWKRIARCAEEGTYPTGVAIENHSNDSRVRFSKGNIVQTLSSRMGTGGNNVPCVMNERQYALTVSKNTANTLTSTDYKGTQCLFEPITLKIRSGCEGGGKGALVQENKSATLGCNNDQTLFEPKAYGICSQNSNAMKSDNPKSGVYEADTSRTLDTSNQSPSKNQGDIAVVCVDQGDGKSSCSVSEEVSPTLACTHGGEPAVCVQGSLIGRGDKNGPNGSGVNEDVSFTLNATDKHAVAYGIDRAAFNQGQNALYNFAVEEELEPTYYTSKNANETVEYAVRRLTPTECARLQGFPDWWCSELETENPTNEDILFWHKVFEEYRLATVPDKKAKTGKQIIKWLKAPYSDSAEYKMWGNGVCLSNVWFVLAGIVWSLENEQEQKKRGLENETWQKADSSAEEDDGDSKD